jgi:hypothetical protein
LKLLNLAKSLNTEIGKRYRLAQSQTKHNRFNKKVRKVTYMTELEELKVKQQELLEQQKEIGRQQEEVAKRIQQLNGVRLKDGETYYFVRDFGIVNYTTYQRNAIVDEWRISQGNCFKTAEEAEQYFENLRTRGELVALANELNGNEEIDWTNDDQYKYFIYYDYDYDEENGLYDAALWQGRNWGERSQGVIYCLNEHFVKLAIEKIGKERLINMIKGGV